MKSCDMGVGCQESGLCYAIANGHPEECPMATASARYEQVDDLMFQIEERLGKDPIGKLDKILKRQTEMLEEIEKLNG